MKTHRTQGTTEAAIHPQRCRFIPIHHLLPIVAVVRSHHHHHHILGRSAIASMEMPMLVSVLLHQPRYGHQLYAENVVDIDVDVAGAAVDHNHSGKYLHQNNGG